MILILYNLIFHTCKRVPNQKFAKFDKIYRCRLRSKLGQIDILSCFFYLHTLLLFYNLVRLEFNFSGVNI